MKPILPILIIVCFSSVASGQIADSTILRMDQQLTKHIAATREISLHLEKSHRQYVTGMALTFAGAAVTAVSAVISTNSNSTGDSLYHINGKEDNTGAVYGIIAGSALTLTGLIITLNSHRQIGLAGRAFNKHFDIIQKERPTNDY